MDYSIAYYLNHLGMGTSIDKISEIISSLIFLIIFWIFTVLLILFIDKKNGKWVIFTILTALALYFLINDAIFKYFISDFVFRLRPYLSFPNDIVPLGKQLIDTSFPSGHVSSTAAILTVIVYNYRKTWPLALVFILTMAFSRIHNGMHYPSDVLAGMVFGILYGIMAISIVKLIKKRYPFIKDK